MNDILNAFMNFLAEGGIWVIALILVAIILTL